MTNLFVCLCVIIMVEHLKKPILCNTHYHYNVFISLSGHPAHKALTIICVCRVNLLYLLYLENDRHPTDFGFSLISGWKDVFSS